MRCDPKPFDRWSGRIGRLIIVSLIIAILLQLKTCSQMICQEEILLRDMSPDKFREIVVERVNCGAMMGFVGNFHIVPTVQTGLARKTLFLRTKGPILYVSWTGEGNIRVDIGPAAEIILQKKQVRDVGITLDRPM